jgi:hypothetical protein
MDYKWIGFLGTLFVGLTLISQICGGAFFSTTDVAIMNQISITQMVDIGFMSLVVPNTNFLSGIYHMMTFDYGFFSGNGQLILFAIYSITFMVSFMLFITVIGLGINAIRSR